MTAAEFRLVLEQHYERLRRFVRSRVANPEEADDIVQDVCLRAVGKLDSIRDPERVESWLYQIARNAIIDHYRRSRPAAPIADDIPGDEDVARLTPPDITGCMTRLLDDLNPADQEALRLTAFDGLKQRELAERLGISVSGAKSRVQRARHRLRGLVETCCHPEVDRLGGIININPPETCQMNHGEYICLDECPAC